MLSSLPPRFHPATVADQRAEDERQDRRHADQTECPPHRLADHRRHESGKNVIDTPNLPVTVLRRLLEVLRGKAVVVVDKPNATSRAFSAEGLMRAVEPRIIATPGCRA